MLTDLVARGRIRQAEIAMKCDWYTKEKKPDQARVSSYMTGTKFSMPAYAWIAKRVFNLSLPQLFAAASNEVSLTLEQTEINRIMGDLSKDQNKALVATAKSMQLSLIHI